MAAGCMFFEEPGVQEALQKIVGRLTADAEMRRDLMQEALLHLWQTEALQQDRTRSWRLLNCQHFLQDYLRRGRSLDSWKHGSFRSPLPSEAGSPDWPIELLQSDEPVWSGLCAKEMMDILCQWISPIEKAILRELCLQKKTGEIAKELQVSPQAVNHHRQRIRALAIKIGFRPRSGHP